MSDHALNKFLNDHRVRDKEYFSHTSMIQPWGKFYIPPEETEELHDLYSAAINDGHSIGLNENPEDVVPLIVDVDFTFSMDRGVSRRYKKHHVIELIKIYQEIISSIVTTQKDKYKYCCVLEKKRPREKNDEVKDGFHLHFPYFFTEKWIQSEYIRDIVIKQVEATGIFKDLHCITSVDRIFDKGIPHNMWLMYGSRKEPNAMTYVLTRAYDHTAKEIGLSVVFKKTYSGKYEKNLFKYLSIRQGSLPTKIDKTKVVKKTTARFYRKRIYKREVSDILEDIKQADTYLELVSDHRADDYHLWWEMGCVLYNITEGHPCGLERWIDFSKRSSKFREGECEEKWERMEMRHYSIRSLKHFAKSDNPEKCAEIIDDKVMQILQHGISNAHNDLAKILYALFEDQYICADPTRDDYWYVFRGHHWVQDKNAISLRRHLSHTLANKYHDMTQKYLKDFQNTEDPALKQYYNAKIGMITNVIKQLKNNSFKNGVIKEAREYFFHETFTDIMDENFDLLVCENGVYDAKQKLFRDGRPDDYCTKSTGVYFYRFKQNDPKMQRLDDIFKKMFPNKKLFKYFKQTTSGLIRGGNRDKILIIWNGKGNNGKSICAKLLKYALGKYHYAPPTSLLTGKSSGSGSATAELIPCKGARALVFAETGNDDAFNGETTKKLTGGDPIYARGLFKESTEIAPHFCTILHCNKLPKMNPNDKAMHNRAKVLDFISEFVMPNVAPKTEDDQWNTRIFPMDLTLKDDNVLKDLADAFLWWLIKEYEETGDDILEEPEEVTMATQKYKSSNDFYMNFIDDNLIKTNDQKDYVSMVSIYAMFREWFKFRYPNSKIPDMNVVKDSIEAHFGKCVKSVWRGVKVFNIEEDLGMKDEEDVAV